MIDRSNAKSTFLSVFTSILFASLSTRVTNAQYSPCSICGTCTLTNPDGQVTLPPGFVPGVTVAACSAIEEIAQSGQLPPDICEQAAAFPDIVDNCGCVCSAAPTRSPTVAPTNPASTFVPNPPASTIAPTQISTTLTPSQTRVAPTVVPADTPFPTSTEVPVPSTPAPMMVPTATTVPIPTSLPVTDAPSRAVPSLDPIRPSEAPTMLDTIEPTKEEVPKTTTVYCRCERRREDIYQRQRGGGGLPRHRSSQWQNIRDIFYNDLRNFDGYVVVNGITILPRNDPECREQHLRSHGRQLQQDDGLRGDHGRELQFSNLRVRDPGSLRERLFQWQHHESDLSNGKGKGSKSSKSSKASKSHGPKSPKATGRSLVFRCPKRF